MQGLHALQKPGAQTVAGADLWRGQVDDTILLAFTVKVTGALGSLALRRHHLLLCNSHTAATALA
jgi:hypothetical protein